MPTDQIEPTFALKVIMVPQIKVPSESLLETVSSTGNDDNNATAVPLDEGVNAVAKNPEPEEAQRVRRLPTRSKSSIGLPWTCNTGATFTRGGTPKAEIEEERIRRPPPRTSSIPKRIVWKDKGGKCRYVLHDEPPPAEVKYVGLETVAKEALTDAVVASGAAALAILDAVAATRRCFDRQLSQRRISAQQASTASQDNAESAGGNSPQGRRGSVCRSKSLGAIRGSGSPIMPCRQLSPERTWLKAPAA
jgi:hypothetical protein